LSEIITVFAIGQILAWYTTVPVSYLYFGAATIVAVIVASRIRHFTPYVFSLLSWIFGIISLWLLIRYSIQLTPLAVVGNEFVNKEIFFDTVIYLKPATLFMFTAFLYFAFGLESPSWKERLRNMAPEFRRILLIIAFLVAVTSIFEFTYNAIFLGSRIVNGENPDEVINPFPQVGGLSVPINVVFALKMITLILGCSIYAIEYLRRIEKREGTIELG